jgi:ATP/ADP translocase
MTAFFNIIFTILGSYLLGLAFSSLIYIFMVRVFPRQFGVFMVSVEGEDTRTIQQFRDNAMGVFSLTEIIFGVIIWNCMKWVGNRLLNISNWTTKPLMRMARSLAGANPDA